MVLSAALGLMYARAIQRSLCCRTHPMVVCDLTCSWAFMCYISWLRFVNDLFVLASELIIFLIDKLAISPG